MPTYRAQVVLPMFTNKPEDVITNTLHFDPLTDLDMQETIDIVMPRLNTLYGSFYSSGRGIATYVGGGSGFQVRWYDLQAPPPRAPIIVPMTWTVTQSISIIPTEVSMVLSFQAPQVSGFPQSRRRGRIYLGGLTSAWMEAGTGSSYPRFTATAVTQVANAADVFATTLQGDGVRWTVWSQVDQASAIVTNGWVDNAPDTQRRRSVDASARTLWSI